MILGAISNSWKLQLPNHDLKELIKDVHTRGAGHIELRQSCMGVYETGAGNNWQPQIQKLAALAGSFPKISFSLAIEWSCLSLPTDRGMDLFRSALRAAVALSAKAPHLRLVDWTRFDVSWRKENEVSPIAIRQTAALTHRASDHGVTLSIENIGQTIAGLTLLVQMVRDRLPRDEGMYLGICPDPTNQLPLYPDTDPVAEIENTPPDILKIVHFKQTRGRTPHPTIAAGDSDCLRQLDVLRRIDYRGTIVMEIPAHERVMENLSESYRFLGFLGTG